MAISSSAQCFCLRVRAMRSRREGNDSQSIYDDSETWQSARVRAPPQSHLVGVAGGVEATRRAQLLDLPRSRNRQTLRLRRDRIGRVVGEDRADRGLPAMVGAHERLNAD